jgi:ABC-type Fe3+/spermidine/putrescine transport system ATPase subunit
MDELPYILHRAGVTVITVTHDQEEAFAIADCVAIMRAGEVVQIGTPEALYRHPGSAWVARFLGLTNLLDARVIEQGQVETALGGLEVKDTAPGYRAGQRTQLLIRPEAAQLTGDGPNRLDVEVVERSFRGGYYQLDVRHRSSVVLTFNFSANADLPETGTELALSLDPQGLTLLRDKG